jgi:hypothetical protein
MDVRAVLDEHPGERESCDGGAEINLQTSDL